MNRATAFILVLLVTASAAAREGTATDGSEHQVRTEATSEFETTRLTPEDPGDHVGLRNDASLLGVRGDVGGLAEILRVRANYDTLWIFDADFEDMSQPNNQGWVSDDRSGTLGQENYWHKDTIRINGFTHLGDSTWWCGTYDPCWIQPRGYGNDWRQHLWRDFPLSEWSIPGDEVSLTFDQRFAIENYYDYGYVDASTDGGATWTTHTTVSNPGFFGKPGRSQDWDSSYGHQLLDMSAYAGTDVRLRFRFESDEAYSSQDEFNNGPPNNSVQDGAWQLDNLTWHVWDAVVWIDDCESPGDNGWVHEDVPTTGQTGVTWRRTFEDPPYERGARPGWMMSAYDSLAGTTVDHESTILNSPPIDIAGATALVAEWTGWQDLPPCSNAVISLWLTVGDSPEEVYCSLPGGFGWPTWGWYSGGPFYLQVTDDWTAYAGSDWLGLWWWQSADTADEPGCHSTGFMLDRQRLGVPVPTTATVWSYSPWDRFDDTFNLEAALEDTARVTISDDDGIATADLLVSDDGGMTWSAYALVPVAPGGDDWLALPPVGHLGPATEILYYFHATDLTGDMSTLPANAPDAYYEYSVLPIAGSTGDPAILLVDKHGGRVPGADWDYALTSEYYYREALDILGHVYDVYDVPVPGSATDLGNGPDTSGMKYYDTQIWFASNAQGPVITLQDQTHLLTWLNEGMGGIDRNFLMSGNNMSEWISSIFLDFLATEFVSGSVSNVQVDLADAPGEFDFMTHGDRECGLHRGDLSSRNTFDVLQPTWVAGSEIVANYAGGAGLEPAGVAYSTPLMTYQTVNLGFGLESVMDERLPSGDYTTGIHDRVDLLGNIMEYFGKASGGPGTGVDEQFTSDNRLARAYPNPFRPSTTIEYVVSSPGRATLRVYDPAGRVVATLVDAVVEPGRHEAVWDGRTSTGERAASGIYFVRMETGGFSSAKKVVLLR